MQNPLELKGYWWLPNLEENKLPGTLTFSQEDGAILELVGVFDSKKMEPVPQLPIILGITQQGKPITLYKCIINNWTYPLVGLGGGKYRAHFVFEGVHFETEEQIRFNQLCGNYTDLNAWVDIYGFAIEVDTSDGKFVSNIRYEKPTSQFFEVGDGFEVGIGFSSHGPKHSIIQTEAEISQRAYLVVKSKNDDICFDTLFKQLNTFTYLLQFGVQRIPYPLSVFGFSKENPQELGDGKAYYPEINIYYTPIEPIANQKEKLPQEFLYTFRDLSADQISAWFTSFEKYETIIHLYRSLFYSNRLFIDAKFLNIAQSLESLHSILFNGEYLSYDKFVEQKEKALQSVPAELTEWVEDALSNANYKRFRQKIFELLNNKKETAGRFVDDLELFAKRVTSTRNEFVHHNKQKWTFQKEELPSAIYRLTMIFELYLLEVLGFSDDKVKELLEPEVQTHLTGWKHLRTIKK
jgi:ApeA-like protein/HEPN superfamily Apea-like protein